VLSWELVADLGRLPDDQREALVLVELGDRPCGDRSDDRIHTAKVKRSSSGA
jgi:DNA-directed RNA polymerase specialized sigma24 family protein